MLLVLFGIFLHYVLFVHQYDDAEKRREMAKNSLERYTHYYERWATNQSVCFLFPAHKRIIFREIFLNICSFIGVDNFLF